MPNGLNIVFVARFHPPINTGAARRLGGLSRELRAQLEAEGGRLFVLAPTYDGPEGGGLAIPHPNPQPGTQSAGGRKSLRDHLRDWLLWPDADIRWSRRAAEAFLQDMPFTPDWVVSSSPPESAHAAGLMIAKATGAKWVADFRDLWLARPLYTLRENKLRRILEAIWARRITRQANILLGVDTTIQAELNAFAGTDKAILLPHFTDLPDVAPTQLEGGKTHFVHTGSFTLSDPDRHIETLLEAFEIALAARPSVRLHLAGRLTPEEIGKIEASPASEAIHIYGVLERGEAIALQMAADGLILTGGEKSDVPPGKAVEYYALNRSIIVTNRAKWRHMFHPEDTPPAQLMMDLANGGIGQQTLPHVPNARESVAALLHILRDHHEHANYNHAAPDTL